MNANELRRRASELLAESEAVLTGIPEGDEPPADIAEKQRALADKAEALIEQAEQLEAQAARRAEIAARNAAGPERSAHNDPVNTRNGRHEYSSARAIAMQLRGGSFDGLEGEVHSDLVRHRPNTRGVLIPMDAIIRYRAFSASGAIATVVQGTIEDALMSRLVLSAAGVRSIVSSTLFKLPLATSGATYWVNNASPTAADRSIGSAAFTDHTIAAKTKAGRQDLVTASVSVETYLWDQLLADIAVGLQAGCLHGSGSSGEPKGLFTYTGNDGVDLRPGATNGAALDYATVLAMAGAVANANAGAGSFITNEVVFSTLESVPKVTGQANFVADAAAGTIAGRTAFRTSSVRSNLTKGTASGVLSAIAFGDWTKAVIGLFSGIDVIANPYTDDGGVTVSAFLDCDFQLTRPAAFSIAVDVKTS